MEFKRKTEIFVETNRRFVIHQAASTPEIFCPRCSEPMLTAEQTAELFKMGRRSIYRMIETGSVHFTETEATDVMICPTSLAANIDAARNQLPARAEEDL